MATSKGFDDQAFYRALASAVEERDLNWKQVSLNTGVSASTLTRMSQGKKPDAASLAALSAWSGLNPADFVVGIYQVPAPEERDVVSEVAELLRSQPNLSGEAKEALESIFKVAYGKFKDK